MNILILYTNFGAGHSFCAKQLEDILNSRFEGANVYRANTKKISSPLMTGLIEKVYMDFFTKNAPNVLVKNLYGFMFFLSNKIKPINYFFVQKTGEKKALEMIEEKNIDLVICTYPYYLDTDVKCIIALTDYGFFDVWRTKDQDIYLVNDKNNIEDVKKRGIKKENIHYSQIRLSPKFDQENNKTYVSRVLFNLGARGQFKYGALVKNIDKLLEKNIKISVMCGKNQKLYYNLNKKYGDKIIIYPFVKNVYDVLKESDLIITKAGGISISECIQSEKPMIINLSQTLKGQEKSNYEYILKNDIGECAKEKDIYIDILNYYDDSSLYEQKVKNIKALKYFINSQKNIEQIIKDEFCKRD